MLILMLTNWGLTWTALRTSTLTFRPYTSKFSNRNCTLQALITRLPYHYTHNNIVSILIFTFDHLLEAN